MLLLAFNFLFYLFNHQHPFVRKTRRSDVILELIHRTKTAVKQLDNLQFRRLNKLLVNGANEEGISDPASMVDVDDNTSLADDTSSMSHAEVRFLHVYTE